MRAGTIISAAALLAACSAPPQPPTVSQPPTSVPATASPTPQPLAARVNGDAITLEQFEREVQRFESSLQKAGIDLATQGDYRTEVLQLLVDRKLLVQAALTIGPDVTKTDLEQAIANTDVGEAGFADWLASAGYAEDEFWVELREEKLAALMIETIINAMAAEVDQVHARHILVSTEAEAQVLLQDLQAGIEFSLLARLNSLDPSTRPAGGDLGWFPPGTLTTPELEEVAFTLQPGEVSGIIETDLGFHILELLERERRPLTGSALIDYRTAAVDRWLDEQRARAAIEILVEG